MGVFRNDTNLKRMFLKREKPTNKPCIYQIPCKNCNKVYIGKTIYFERRRREHRDAIRRGDENSAVFKHLQEGHVIDFENMNKFTSVPDTYQRKLLESVLIQNSKTFNVYQSNFKLDSFINYVLTKHVTTVNRLLTRVNKPP